MIHGMTQAPSHRLYLLHTSICQVLSKISWTCAAIWTVALALGNDGGSTDNFIEPEY